MSASLVGSEMCIRDSQKEQLIKRLQDGLVAERSRSSVVAQASRAANEHLKELVREGAAGAQAEQARIAQDARNEIA
eukprot:2479541-Alexandrium_andersonii.AAC.1